MRRNVKTRFFPLLFASLLSCFYFALPCVARMDNVATANHGSHHGVTRYNKARTSLSGIPFPLPEGKAKTMSDSILAQDKDGTPLSTVPIIGRESQPMLPAVTQTLVRLQCEENFSHMWGEPTQTGAGQAHIGADGVLMEPPAIASALLKVYVEDPKTKTREFVFKVASDADLQIVADYEKAISINPATGEDFGPLVRIECPTLAGEVTTTPAGTKIEFDSSGMGVTGERIYQQMRPAFGGDGSNQDKDAHPIIFHSYVQSAEANQANQSSNGSQSNGRQVASAPAAPLVSTSAAPPLSTPVSASVPAAPLISEQTSAQSNDSESSDSKVEEAPGASTASTTDSITASTTDVPSGIPFMDLLENAVGGDKAKILSEAGLGDEYSLKQALDANQLPRGIGASTVKKLSELLQPPAPAEVSEQSTLDQSTTESATQSTTEVPGSAAS